MGGDRSENRTDWEKSVDFDCWSHAYEFRRTVCESCIRV